LPHSFFQHGTAHHCAGREEAEKITTSRFVKIAVGLL
jgi:hypothetical protein